MVSRLHTPVIVKNQEHLETLDLDHVVGGRFVNIQLPFGWAIKNRSQQILESNRSWEHGWSAASDFYSMSRLGKL